MKRLIPLAILLALVTVPATSDAKTYKTNFATAPTGWCSIRAGGGIGCSSAAIPAYTDGYAWIRKRGRARLGDTGDLISPVNVYPTSEPPRLRPGDRWNKKGVRCKAIRGGIKCSNGQHGFRLTKRNYRIW